MRMRTVVSMGALLPGLGCYFCIAYTYLFQFERVLNFTQSDQCPTVHSILPPVSYSIGVWEPQKFFWLIVMFLHMPPRIFFLVLYRRLFLNSAPKSMCFRGTIWFYMKTLWLEPMGLIIVSVVDIHSHFVIHAIAYGIWITSFNFNMLFNLILHHCAGIREQRTTMEITWRIKLFMFVTGCALSVSTAISYPLFMSYCSPTAYLAFSIAEYIMVGYNSFFYCLTFWEFPKTRVTLGIRTGPHPNKVLAMTTSSVVDVNKIPL